MTRWPGYFSSYERLIIIGKSNHKFTELLNKIAELRLNSFPLLEKLYVRIRDVDTLQEGEENTRDIGTL